MQRWTAILSRVVRETSLKKGYFSKDFKEVREQAMWIYGRGHFRQREQQVQRS